MPQGTPFGVPRHLTGFLPRTLDVLLLLMTLIWGTNYPIVKAAFAEMNPQAFNALRLLLGSAMMLVMMSVVRRTRFSAAHPDGNVAVGSVFHTPAVMTRRDWLGIVALGIVGHCVYQYLFIGGLARTSVANSSLLLAMTPVLIAVYGALSGRERIRAVHWAGTLLSLVGIYIVVGHGAHIGGASVRGDLMMSAAVVCWAAYTVGARPLMKRHSPLGVTGLSMSFGTLLYLPIAAPSLARVSWNAIGAHTWAALVYSAVFSLCVAYTIWYAAVREIGSARTSIYSNVVPIVAMLTAVVWLGEPLSASKIVGAAAVLLGVALTRTAEG
jgi:drug/metabolite transporter (DMT)-like permease